MPGLAFCKHFAFAFSPFIADFPLDFYSLDVFAAGFLCRRSPVLCCCSVFLPSLVAVFHHSLLPQSSTAVLRRRFYPLSDYRYRSGHANSTASVFYQDCHGNSFNRVGARE